MDFKAILELLSFLIKEAEEYLGAGTGPEKKKAVMDAITKLVTTLKINVPAFIMDNLGIIIDILVFFYNIIKAFKKKQTP